MDDFDQAILNGIADHCGNSDSTGVSELLFNGHARGFNKEWATRFAKNYAEATGDHSRDDYFRYFIDYLWK